MDTFLNLGTLVLSSTLNMNEALDKKERIVNEPADYKLWLVPEHIF